MKEKKNQKNPQSMWPMYITFTLNTERTTTNTPPTMFSLGFGSSGTGQFHLEQTEGDGKTEPGCWTGPRAGGGGRGGAAGAVLPGELTHHLQQSLVLLFQLLVLVLDVVQVLARQRESAGT